MRTKEEYQEALEKILVILRMSVYTNTKDWEAFYQIKELIDNLKENDEK